MMASSNNTLSWYHFFSDDCGIPREAADKYAVNFAENRITMDMLQDLNKEYLKELGVSVLGDVIAILKNSKKKFPSSVVNEKVTPALPKPVPALKKPDSSSSSPPLTTSSITRTSRLGPPPTKAFPESSPSVFNRLEQQQQTNKVSTTSAGSASSTSNAVKKRKSYIVVKTMADGSKIKEKVYEDDPEFAKLRLNHTVIKKMPSHSSPPALRTASTIDLDHHHHSSRLGPAPDKRRVTMPQTGGSNYTRPNMPFESIATNARSRRPTTTITAPDSSSTSTKSIHARLGPTKREPAIRKRILPPDDDEGDGEGKRVKRVWTSSSLSNNPRRRSLSDRLGPIGRKY